MLKSILLLALPLVIFSCKSRTNSAATKDIELSEKNKIELSETNKNIKKICSIFATLANACTCYDDAALTVENVSDLNTQSPNLLLKMQQASSKILTEINTNEAKTVFAQMGQNYQPDCKLRFSYFNTPFRYTAKPAPVVNAFNLSLYEPEFLLENNSVEILRKSMLLWTPKILTTYSQSIYFDFAKDVHQVDADKFNLLVQQFPKLVENYAKIDSNYKLDGTLTFRFGAHREEIKTINAKSIHPTYTMILDIAHEDSTVIVNALINGQYKPQWQERKINF